MIIAMLQDIQLIYNSYLLSYIPATKIWNMKLKHILHLHFSKNESIHFGEVFIYKYFKYTKVFRYKSSKIHGRGKIKLITSKKN